jgi:hypothetical protein
MSYQMRKISFWQVRKIFFKFVELKNKTATKLKLTPGVTGSTDPMRHDLAVSIF